MKLPRSPLFFTAACAAALSPLAAQQPAAPAVAEFKAVAGRIDLKDGDTFVFLGDSITHQCLYTQYVEDYFYTRYPATRIHFHNAGVGGDRARNALDRFDDDVASFKPKYVSVLLGMNDGAYTNYQQPIFDTYQKDMNTLLDRIAELGATAIPMTPTMHDARAARLTNHGAEPRDTYYNGVLSLYGRWLEEQSQVRGLGFVDMFSPLNSITLEQRKADPSWTMIKDAVHPGMTGQVVMAAAILNDMGPRGSVSHIAISEKNGKVIGKGSNGALTDFQSGETISFTFKANSLPWVLPDDAAEGAKLTQAGHKFGIEKLTARNLKPGSYELKIDGELVGKWSDGQLAFGIELEENAKTPQYQQALKVALLNKQRNEQVMHPLRDQWSQLKGKRSNLKKAQEAEDPQIDAKKEEFEKWHAEMKTTVATLLGKAKEFEDQIYAVNQPQP
ncbi:MAG: GDSL-like Lipase/Acylhydrolase, partial [Chthoniobacteraceae bacterium]|nr:GDSL-like Lipase/Acylhydrolase [Chthoniobacteraceae bacterium]